MTAWHGRHAATFVRLERWQASRMEQPSPFSTMGVLHRRRPKLMLRNARPSLPVLARAEQFIHLLGAVCVDSESCLSKRGWIVRLRADVIDLPLRRLCGWLCEEVEVEEILSPHAPRADGATTKTTTFKSMQRTIVVNTPAATSALRLVRSMDSHNPPLLLSPDIEGPLGHLLVEQQFAHLLLYTVRVK